MRMQQSQNEKPLEEVAEHEEPEHKEKPQPKLEKKKTHAPKEEAKEEKKGILNIFKKKRKDEEQTTGKGKLGGKKSPKSQHGAQSAQALAKKNPNSNIPKPKKK